MMDPEHHPYIEVTVIPPEGTDPPSVNVFESHRSHGEYDYQSPSPILSPGLTLDGSQSEGYPSSPDTPSDLGFQNDHPTLPPGSPYLDNLGLWPELSSPSLLSPAFGFLNLGDNGNGNQTDEYFDNNTNLKVDQSQQIRTSLSPLTIPPPSLHSPQLGYSEADFMAEYLTPDVDNAASTFDPSAFSVDDMGLLQHQPRPSPSHMRANSEMNMPWSGSLSPSVILTPSEPSTSPSFLLNTSPTFTTDDYTLASVSNLNRRHSHTGVSGRGRGRLEGRSAPSSRGSSRGSSPYERPMALEASSAPALGQTGMSISPTQIFSDELNQLLTVPLPSHLEHGHHPRRHSIHMGTRPELYGTELYEPYWGTGEASGEAQSPMTPGSTPATPTTPSRALQVASEAGISASQRRRTKVAKFACPTCPQTFTTNHNLKNHINAHLGVKNHQCEHCARAFTTASVLARHCKTCKSAPHVP